LLRKGLSDIKLNSLEIEKEYKIKLDPKLNSKDNIDKYFEKAKDEKVNFNKSVELFKLTKDKYDNLQTEFENFKLAKTIDEITEIYNRIIPKKEKIVKMDSGEKFKYWLYKIDDKYSVYIGRDSKSNDYLSIKFANQNDYWFHARGLPGSHVVLRVDNLKEIMPKEIIKKAACLAAYYSKAKTAGSAPVSYTFAKFVHKKKGMEPGKVLLQKENSILVKPEIPKNCELINE
jgi:predicted ribosome quality control (RQC) complex YloA/Tae2 family protein